MRMLTAALSCTPGPTTCRADGTTDDGPFSGLAGFLWPVIAFATSMLLWGLCTILGWLRDEVTGENRRYRDISARRDAEAKRGSV